MHLTHRPQFWRSKSFTVQEIRRIWVGYMTQCDQELGRKLAAKLHSMSAL